VISVVVDDLAFVSADAVVRPTTALLEPVAPALRRLEQLAGADFLKQLTVPIRLGVGAAVVTGAGELEPDFMIHAVIWSEDEPVTTAGLRRTITSVLQRAEDWGLARISTPVLGTGPGALPLEDAAHILVQTLTEHLPTATYPEEVCIVVESEEDRDIVQALLRGGTTK
jgi:O-acetyl-ADP-ribose deacetylase (regulator of RNase III)